MTIEEFKGVIDFLRSAIKNTEYENHVYLVGGCVRDYLMGDTIADIDIAIDIPNGGYKFSTWLTQRENCWSPFNPTQIGRLGTYRFLLTNNKALKHVVFDCVQTRRNPSFAVPEGSPVANNLGTILEDGVLRDLTINSLYLDISALQIVDLNGGVKDITNNILRLPNIASIVLKDDPLRMMRIIRFSSKYGWEIDKDTWMGILKYHSLIKDVSVERFREELNQILLSPCPSYGLKKLLYSGMLFDMIPQLYSLNHVGKNLGLKFVENQWKHTLAVVDEVQPKLINRLAALFHDIGKQATWKIVDGRIRFYGHESTGATIAKSVMTKLKYPNLIIDAVVLCIQNHMRLSSLLALRQELPSPKTIRRFLTDVGKHKDLVLDVIKADFISRGNLENFNRIEELINDISEELDYTNLKIPINGMEICDYLNIKQSPLVGKIIEYIKSKMMEKPDLTKEEAFDCISEYYATKCMCN